MIPGINSTISSVSVICASVKSSDVKACTDKARSWIDAAFLVEVTTTSSISCATRLNPDKETIKGNNSNNLFKRKNIRKPPLGFEYICLD